MAEPSRVDQLRAAGIHSVPELLYRLETLERSDRWVYITCDRLDDDTLHLVNATGFFPDEMSAALAGQIYIREWNEKGLNEPDENPPEIFPVPLFIESEMPVATATTTHEEKIAWLVQWAHENRVMFDQEGECGFGRDCVGISDGRRFLDVDYGFSSDPWDIYDPDGRYTHLDREDRQRIAKAVRDERLDPGEDAPDAYHKHDCLAVLGRGEEAEAQLYAWVRRLADAGAFVERVPRTPKSGLDAILHGVERPRLTFETADDQQAKIDAILAETNDG